MDQVRQSEVLTDRLLFFMEFMDGVEFREVRYTPFVIIYLFRYLLFRASRYRVYSNVGLEATARIKLDKKDGEGAGRGGRKKRKRTVMLAFIYCDRDRKPFYSVWGEKLINHVIPYYPEAPISCCLEPTRYTINIARGFGGCRFFLLLWNHD
ncbi:hypothetical protein F4810DRAFT_257779 [Camillea tinctor]|nr:hypothetical protein F4810DRAFT_257779 [Camillea tinctor]